MYEYSAKVVKVIDADTLDLDVDLGLRVHTKARIRVIGINAPEYGSEAGKAAAARLRELLPVGDTVIVRTQKDKTEKYGRWLGTITAAPRTWEGQLPIDIATVLVDEGHAVYWDGTGKRPT